MDKSAIRFFKKDAYLKSALDSGKDVYSAFAAKLFNCSYNECLEFNPDTNEHNHVGQCRRKTAKFILCSMYFSTKKQWHKSAFDIINEVPYFLDMVYSKEPLNVKE